MPKVAFAYVHGDQRASSFDDSREALVAHDRAHERVLDHDHGRIAVRCGTDGLVAARNTVAAQVVASDVDWLLWVDSDMGFAPDTLYRLLEVAHPELRPMVGALCFASRQYAHDGMNGYRTRPSPTLFAWIEGDDGVPRFTSVPLYPVDSLVQVAATGSACVLIHRTVLERIAEEVGPAWYDRTPGTDGRLLGEDISFCVRAGFLEIPIFVHTGVRTTHLKPQWVGELDHWQRYVPPPARERVAVLAHGASEDFLATLVASTGLAEARHGDGLDAARGDEPWLFVGAPDCRFTPGWLDHAQHVADKLEAVAVSVHNPAEPSDLGQLLVRRAFAEEIGTVDVEKLVAAAQERGVWQLSLGAVVERG